MFKKAGAVAIAAAGLMLLGSPAFATPHGEDDNADHYIAIGEAYSEYDNQQYYEDGEEGDYADQFGLINFGNDSDLLSQVNLCSIEIIPIIPILSENDETVCIATDNDDNDEEAHGGNND
jgi:hypothetical protein